MRSSIVCAPAPTSTFQGSHKLFTKAYQCKRTWHQRTSAVRKLQVLSRLQQLEQRSARPKYLPNIYFRFKPKEVEIVELAQLLDACNVWSAAPFAKQQQRQFNDEEQMLTQLQIALNNSIAVVAAYAREDALPSYSSRTLDASQAGSRWRWSGRARNCLVGFARAAGDQSLVATLHDVAVLPELQGLGLGRKMLRKLTNQVYAKGIMDVGLLSPPCVSTFFERCNFGPDPEGSTPMALRPDQPISSQQQQQGGSQYLNVELLQHKLMQLL